MVSCIRSPWWARRGPLSEGDHIVSSCNAAAKSVMALSAASLSVEFTPFSSGIRNLAVTSSTLALRSALLDRAAACPTQYKMVHLVCSWSSLILLSFRRPKKELVFFCAPAFSSSSSLSRTKARWLAAHVPKALAHASCCFSSEWLVATKTEFSLSVTRVQLVVVLLSA